MKKINLVPRLLVTLLSTTILAGCTSQNETEIDTADTTMATQMDVYEQTKPTTPDDALMLLQEGNQRFIANEPANFDLGQDKRDELVEGQEPFAVVVTCSDSRVVPEHLYDQGIGDLFVIRVAGNILDDAEIGSIEYAVDHLDSPLVVILGHEGCGAVSTAVAKDADPEGTETTPYIDAFLDNIEPAVEIAKESNLEGDALVDKTVNVNVELTVEQLLNDSTIVKDRAEKGEVAVVGAKYLLEKGDVTWFK